MGKCLESLVQLELEQQSLPRHSKSQESFQYQLIIIGGLCGRLDQTIHTLHALSLLNEQGRRYTWVVGRDSLACVLGKVGLINLPPIHFYCLPFLLSQAETDPKIFDS